MENTNLPATQSADVAMQPNTSTFPAKSVFSIENDDLLSGINTEALKTAEESAMNISTQYYDFQLGKPLRCVYLGSTIAKTVTDQGEEVILPAVVFVDETRTMYTNSGIQLVKSLEALPAKTPVQITWTGTKKTGSGGQMRLFDVRILKVNI